MTDVPTLSPSDIRERLDQLFGEHQPKRRSHLVALFGTGEEVRVATARAGEFSIIPVRSEIELRKLVPDLDADDPHIAFLVPWTGSLPLDIGATFAAGGRILTLGRDLRLRRLFRATEIESAALDCALTKYLLSTGDRTMPFGGGRLTLDAMWTAWLASDLGIGDGSAVSAEEVVAWAALTPRNAALIDRVSSLPDLRVEMTAWMRRRLGPAAVIAWRAWEAGAGDKPLQYALVLDAMLADAASDSGEARMWRSLKLRELGAKDDAEAQEIAGALAAVAAGAVRHVEGRDPGRLPGILEAADKLLDIESLRGALVTSRWLPSAWFHKLDRLGDELAGGAASPQLSVLERCVALFRDLERHHFFKDEKHKAVLERAEMANRLLAWLVRRPDKQMPAGASTYADVERLARWYAAEGGFVDWARRRARGTGTRAFGRGVNAVVDAADRIRTEQDLAFARALLPWLEAGRPSNAVVPIENAVQHFGVKFLSEREDRRLLVLLLDGMAWAQAAQILLSLSAWGPVGWSARSVRLGNEKGIIPVLAHLPTVTEVSRAAFFASKRTPAGKVDPTDRDVDRWAQNAIVQKLLPPGEVPRLLLRADGHTQSGAASPEALQLVRDPRQRIVALVINAIDASLKGDPQTRHDWTVDTIQSLRDLLETAAEAGRVVLLASDHGHVSADRMVGVGSPPDSKARYRAWKTPDEPIADYEVAIPKAHAWAPTGAHGVVLLADDAHRYGGAAHAGEHGGATLAEVVAPFMLIGPDRATFDPAMEPDPDLQVVPFAAPSWWYPDVHAPVSVVPAPAPTPKKRDSKQLKAQQAAASAPKQLALPEIAPHPLRAALERSEIWKARELDATLRTQLLDTISLLGSRQPAQVPIAVFAQAMGKLPARAPGLASTLAEKLNIDGFDLLRYDPGSKLVTLDVEKLKQVYGLT